MGDFWVFLSLLLNFIDLLLRLEQKLLEVNYGCQIVIQFLVNHSEMLAEFLDDWVLALELLFLQDVRVEGHVCLCVVTRANVSHRVCCFCFDSKGVVIR